MSERARENNSDSEAASHNSNERFQRSRRLYLHWPTLQQSPVSNHQHHRRHHHHQQQQQQLQQTSSQIALLERALRFWRCVKAKKNSPSVRWWFFVLPVRAWRHLYLWPFAAPSDLWAARVKAGCSYAGAQRTSARHIEYMDERSDLCSLSCVAAPAACEPISSR